MKVLSLYQRAHSEKTQNFNVSRQTHTDSCVTDAVLLSANRTKKHRKIGMVCIDARFLRSERSELTAHIHTMLKNEQTKCDDDAAIAKLAEYISVIYCDDVLPSKRTSLAKLHAKYNRFHSMVRLRTKLAEAKAAHRQSHDELFFVVEQTKAQVREMSYWLAKDAICPRCNGTSVTSYISCSVCDSRGTIKTTMRDIINQFRLDAITIKASKHKHYQQLYDSVLSQLYQEESEARRYMSREFHRIMQ